MPMALIMWTFDISLPNSALRERVCERMLTGVDRLLAQETAKNKSRVILTGVV